MNTAETTHTHTRKKTIEEKEESESNSRAHSIVVESMTESKRDKQ